MGWLGVGECRDRHGAAVTPDVTTTSRRLTWNWVVKSRLTKIKEYDVGDYVQDGLYLNFDGIRNAGATAEHDPNTGRERFRPTAADRFRSHSSDRFRAGGA